MTEQNQPITKVAVNELAQKFVDFKLPKHLLEGYKRGYVTVPLNYMKIVLFNTENGVSNDEIDYYLGIPPQRQEDETKEEMRARGKYNKSLLKYLPFLYDYSVYPEREKPWEVKQTILGDFETSRLKN
jgi:2-methylcitrate dehydratase PrpD